MKCVHVEFNGPHILNGLNNKGSEFLLYSSHCAGCSLHRLFFGVEDFQYCFRGKKISQYSETKRVDLFFY